MPCLNNKMEWDWIAQHQAQPSLEHLWGWRFHSLSGQTLPVFNHLRGKHFFPIIYLKFFVFHLVSVASLPITTFLDSRSIFCISSGRVAVANSSFPRAFLLHAEQAQFSHVMFSRTQTFLVSYHWTYAVCQYSSTGHSMPAVVLRELEGGRGSFPWVWRRLSFCQITRLE